MPGPAAHKYQLAGPLSVQADQTPAERAILYYLRVRQLEGKGGATQAQMVEESHMAARTVGAAVRRLVARGVIV